MIHREMMRARLEKQRLGAEVDRDPTSEKRREVLA
jgi:hypothetical protein